MDVAVDEFADVFAPDEAVQRAAAAAEELEEAKRGIARLGGRVEKTETYDIDGAPRCVIVIRKERPTPPAYPRRYAKIKQSPL